MAKKIKIETGKQADSKDPVAGGSEGNVGSRPKSSVAIAKPKKIKGTAKKRQTVTKAGALEKNRPPTKVTEPSDDEIRLRAYFIAERRLRLSLPGDSAHDWVEARRQLVEEARPS